MLLKDHRKIREKLTAKFGDKLEFAKGLVSKPKTVGAIAPTSARMAEKMASVIRPNSGLPVLELGPGTGAITKAILRTGIEPDQLISIEYSSEFLPGLEKRFPKVQFVEGDAFDLPAIAKELGIKQFDCIISALPLLNFPMTRRVRLIRDALRLVEPGRPMVQFSYGPRSPVPARARHFDVEHMDTILRNIPPARIWTYQRPAE